MIIKLTKIKFVNQVVREVAALFKLIEEAKLWCNDRDVKKTLRLSIEAFKDNSSGEWTLRLILRGNIVGSLWWVFDEKFPYTSEGWMAVHKRAGEIFLDAHKRALKKDLFVNDFESASGVDLVVPDIHDYRKFCYEAAEAITNF